MGFHTKFWSGCGQILAAAQSLVQSLSSHVILLFLLPQRRVESELPKSVPPRLGVRPIPVVIFTGIASSVVKDLSKASRPKLEKRHFICFAFIFTLIPYPSSILVSLDSPFLYSPLFPLPPPPPSPFSFPLLLSLPSFSTATLDCILIENLLFLLQIIIRLGGVITTNPRECTHIVTSRIARTIKFLSGISVCGYVVTPKWVEESGNVGIFRDEEEFVLQDSDAEKLFGMNLALSISRAKRTKLLEGMGVYATPAVEPPTASMDDIVSCAGGKLLSLPEVRSVVAGGGRSDLVPRGVIILSTGSDIEKNCCKEFVKKNMSKHKTRSSVIFTSNTIKP